MTDNGKEYIKLHSIQLNKVGVVKLFIHAVKEPNPELEASCEEVPIRVGHTDYDPESKTIWVSLQIEIDAEKNEDLPFSLEVEIIGEFIVDDKNFPLEHIEDWARRNAPMILQPYLREQVYSLTLRCGFKPLILPLIQVPTLKTES